MNGIPKEIIIKKNKKKTQSALKTYNILYVCLYNLKPNIIYNLFIHNIYTYIHIYK